jgi:hypothetical protein
MAGGGARCRLNPRVKVGRKATVTADIDTAAHAMSLRTAHVHDVLNASDPAISSSTSEGWAGYA